MFELVSIEIGGRRYSGWKWATVRRSLEALSGSFTFLAVDKWAMAEVPWPIYPGVECRINIVDEPVARGYVDSISPTISADRHEIQVTGRDRTADLVDCSVPAAPNTWSGLTLYQLAKQLAAPYNIAVQSTAPLGAKFHRITAKSGDTIFDLLSRLAKQRNVLLTTTAAGNLLLENPGARTAADQLVMGKNLLSITGTYDYTGRYAKYEVRGAERTEGEGWKTSTVSVVGTARDQEIVRHRLKVIPGTSVQTRADAINKARWEANINAARSVRWTCTVQGFHQSNGALWEMNMLIPVSVPELRLDANLLSVSVEYSYNESGSVTVMELARSDAYREAPMEVVKAPRDTLGW